MLSPILQRELTVASRRPATFWVRCVAAALMLLLLGTLLAGLPKTTTVIQSRSIYLALTWTAFGGALLSGVFLTADTLSSERREGTLGLLFLTTLSSYDIVIGKAIASAVVGASALLGVLPVLAIPLLIGGISGQEFLGTSAALGATLFASLGIGLYASARCRNLAEAMGLTLLVLTLLCTLPLLGAWVGPAAWAWIGAASPVTAVNNLSQSFSRFRPWGWESASFVAAIGFMGIALAAHRLARQWRTDISIPAPNHSSEATPASPFGRHRRRGPGQLSPCTRWYLGKMRHARPLAVLFALVYVLFWGLLVATWINLSSTNAQSVFIVALLAAYGLHLIFKFQVALLATGPLAQEAAEEGLELLLTTPVDPSELLCGHREAVGRAMSGTQWLLMPVNAALMLNLVNPALRVSGDEFALFLIPLAGGILLILLDPFAISQYGVWFSLLTRRTSRAMARTLVAAYVPTAVFVLAVVLTAGANATRDTMILMLGIGELSLILVAFIRGQDFAIRAGFHFRALASGDPAARRFIDRHFRPPMRRRPRTFIDRRRPATS